MAIWEQFMVALGAAVRSGGGELGGEAGATEYVVAGKDTHC